MATPTRTSLTEGYLRSKAAAVIAVIGLALTLLTAPQAHANSRYAAIVMNSDSGDIIYSRNADLRRYPASLTKLMTLYLLFEAIEDGRLELEDELHVSRRAAGQPPSKLGVEAGSTITVGEAIQALVVRSANDVAVVVAEALADSEWQFARRMTARAAEMGMDHTRFENASGLPHNRQQTTARDLSILAVRVVNDFPRFMHYFSQSSFTYGDRTWNSHNNLLDDYEGTTGLKTGYTRSSGFNLIATVERDDISLIGIVLGGRTASRRDREMVRILDLNFTRLRENPYFGSRIFSSSLRPVLRPDPNDRVLPDPGELLASLVPDEFTNMPTPHLNPDRNRQGVVNASAGINDVAALAATGTDLPTVEGSLERQRLGENTQIALNGPGGTAAWGIAVGEFVEPELADRRLQSVAASLPTQLTWGMAALLPSEGGEQMSFAAGFGPMTEDDAVSICGSLAQIGYDCQPINSVDWNLAVRR